MRRGKARCPCGREARSASAASAGSSQGGFRRWRCGLKLSGVKMPGAAVTHPDRSQVFPIAPEMIRNVDGASKNDSGRNAAARLLADFRREHPHLKTIAIGDGFYLDGSCVNLLKSKNLRFMHGAGPGDHAFMFGWLKRRADVSSLEVRTWSRKGGAVHSLPLGGGHAAERDALRSGCEPPHTHAD